MKQHTPRVAVITNLIPPYRYPIFRDLVAFGDSEYRIFLSEPLEASYDRAARSLPLIHPWGSKIYLSTRHAATGVRQTEPFPVPFMLFPELIAFKPDIVISGEFGLGSMVALVAARMCGARFVLWSEETAEAARNKGGLRTLLRRVLIRQAEMFLAFGMPAARYLAAQWNVKPERVHYCAQAIDNRMWRLLAEQQDRASIRQRLGVQGRVFLAVGKLIQLKGFDCFLKAWSSVSRSAQERNCVVIVGDGIDRNALEQLARELKISNIIFAGYRNPAELVAFYVAADVFVFPSLVDVWGMVVNEALVCGVPVLASRYAGASQELIDGTGAGELIDPLDIEAFSKTLERWCSADLSTMQTRARAVIEGCNFNVTVNAIRQLVHDLTDK
jgi:glycosyltransferase involved in cell wall biosynthesis